MSHAKSNKKAATSKKSPAGARAHRWKMSPASREGAEAGGKAELKAAWEAPVLRLIADQEAIPADQLARFVRCDMGAAERIIEHLEKAGLLQRALGPAEEVSWVWLSRNGASLTGSDYSLPSAARAPQVRMANEARLFAREIFPVGEWLSARVLQGAGACVVPTGVIRSGDREYAVEIEPAAASATFLARKYEDLRAHHRSEGREILVFCAAANVAPLERLSADRGWSDLIVRECPAFDGWAEEKSGRPGEPRPAAAREQSVRRLPARRIQVPMLQIAVAEFPAEGLQAIQEAEGASGPPTVTLVGKRIGGGSPRWRVTTETQVWRATYWQGRWFVSAATADERSQKLLSPELKWRRSKENAGRLPLVQINLDELPREALEAIQEAEGSARLPQAVLAGKCLGCGGFRRFRVTTEQGVWRVSRNSHGWRAWPANDQEKAQEFYTEGEQPEPPAREGRRHDGELSGHAPGVERQEEVPGGSLADVEEFWKDAPNQLTLIRIDPSKLPQEALAAAQEAENATAPPKVILAAKRRGKGFPRYRVTTERGVWRVGGNQRGWHANPSAEWERALEVLAPESDPPHPLVEVPVAELPEEAVQAIQAAEGISSRPQLRLVAKRKGRGFLRFRVTTARGVWRVSCNQLGWYVRPADAEEREQELFSEATPPHSLVPRAIEDLPEEALQTIQEAEGSSFPPRVIEVAKRKGRGFARFRVTTASGVWLLQFNPRGWKAGPASPEERKEKVLSGATPRSAAATKPARPQPLSWAPVDDLPGEAMRLIAEMEGGRRAPAVVLVAKRRGGGSSQRWRVTTDREVWRVTRSTRGWRIRVSEDPERTQELADPHPERLPAACSQPLVSIDVRKLPTEALRAIQEAEHGTSPPKVIELAKRKGRGFPRYRVTTETRVWRVTSNPSGWHVWPAGPAELAQGAFAPRADRQLVKSDAVGRDPHEGRVRASKPKRQPPRRERSGPARDAVEKGGR